MFGLPNVGEFSESTFAAVEENIDAVIGIIEPRACTFNSSEQYAPSQRRVSSASPKRLLSSTTQTRPLPAASSFSFATAPDWGKGIAGWQPSA